MNIKLTAAVSAAALLACAPVAADIMLSADYAGFLAKGAMVGGFDHLAHKDDDDADIKSMKETIDALGTAFEQFKEVNDQALEEVKTKGAEDPVTTEKLEKLNSAVGELNSIKERLDRMELRANRPGAAGGGLGADDPTAEEHRQAFLKWVRNPDDEQSRTELQASQKTYIEELKVKAAKLGGEAMQQRAVTIGSNTAGGYAVPEILATGIHETLVDLSPFREHARVVVAGSSDYKELVDVGGEGYGWVGESDTRSETDTALLEEVAPTFGTVYAYPKASEESLQDIFFDVESWIIGRSGRGLARGEGNAFVNGNGTKKPTGFLNGTPVSIGDEDSPARAFGTLQFFATGTAASFGPSRVDSPAGDPGDVLLTTIYGLKKGYRANAKWMLNQATTGVIRKFKDADGDYLWRPGLVEGQPSTLCGYTAVEDEEMPDIGANAFPVAFGDFMEGYVIVDLAGIRITRDEVTTPGFIKFYVRKRVGGKLLDDDAIKLIKCAA